MNNRERWAAAVFSALLERERPSDFFRALLASGEMGDALPELTACVGVPQNPFYHPEGDVFEHTMLVVDCAAALRERAQNSLGFMLSALAHDLGKAVATGIRPDGRITAYGHELVGRPLCRAMLGRLTEDAGLIDYVDNMVWLHMRPNILAKCHSKKKKTRRMFDLSVCPEDLILLSRADASGKLDAPYDEACEAFLRQRLEDYRQVMALPMVTRADLIAAGMASGQALEDALDRARQLHFSGLDHKRALARVTTEAACQRRRPGVSAEMNETRQK